MNLEFISKVRIRGRNLGDIIQMIFKDIRTAELIQEKNRERNEEFWTKPSESATFRGRHKYPFLITLDK